MVSDKVEIISRLIQSQREWSCALDVRWLNRIWTDERQKPPEGTDIILNVNADSEEFLDEWKPKGILESIASFFR